MMKPVKIAAPVMAFALAAAGVHWLLSPAAAVDNPVTVMASGDIAESGTSQANAMATGDLIREANPAYVVTVGDNAYPDGSASDYATKYEPTWGSFKEKTRPAPGNHEYHANPPAGYLGYFGQANVTTNNSPSQVWYAWDIGNGWRGYSLNTEVSQSATSAQAIWLQADLAAHPGMHYLAYAHQPRYASGTVHGDNTSFAPLWAILQAAGTDLVLFGHEHSYERFAKMNSSGGLSSTGIREIRTGSGGNQLYALDSTRHAGSEFGNDTDFGVLKLVLHTNSYDWQFIASGRGWVNNTSITCGTGCHAKGTILDEGSAATNEIIGEPTPTTTPSPAPSPTPAPTPSPTPNPTPTPTPSPTPSPTPAAGTRHYVSNESGAYLATHLLGYDVHDTGMSAATIATLPAGDQAMVWTGTGKCPTALSSEFTSFVTAQADNPRIYGYYLVDEPDDPSATCVNGIKAMADYIHANAPGKKAFIVLTDYPGTYAAYAPANSHADLIGLDPYPCRRDTTPNCNYGLINSEVDRAVAAGVPLSSVVPTFQVFGDSTWAPPTSGELQTILDTWQAKVPDPQLDYTYSWSAQAGALTDSLVTHLEWQQIMRAHNGAAAPTPEPTTPPPTPTPTTPAPSPTPAAGTKLVCPVVTAPVVGQTVTCHYE